MRVPSAFRALAAAALALVLAACGTPVPPSGPASSGTGAGSTVVPGGQGRLPIVKTIVTNLGPLLPTALEGVAAASLNGKIYLFGGSGPAGYSDAIYAFTPAQGAKPATLARVATLPAAMHDAAAATGKSGIHVCGGGQAVGSSGIYLWNGSTLQLAAHLPAPFSDMAGVTVNGRPYCLGGWTGTTYSTAIYAVSGAAPKVLTHLATAVRYGAAAAIPGGILVAGGELANGARTSSIQWIPMGTTAGTPVPIAALPYLVDKAMAAAVGPTALVAGGCQAGGQARRAIWTVDATGGMQQVGEFPAGLCDGGAALLNGVMYVFGGRNSAGAAQPDVYSIKPLYGFPGA